MYILEDQDRLKSQTKFKIAEIVDNAATYQKQQNNYSPVDNYYSRRNWDLMVQVATLINRELSRSFIAQHTSKSIHMFLSKAKCEYIKLRMMSAVEVYKKADCRQIPCQASV
jgi:hypothetical protein